MTTRIESIITKMTLEEKAEMFQIEYIWIKK